MTASTSFKTVFARMPAQVATAATELPVVAPVFAIDATSASTSVNPRNAQSKSNPPNPNVHAPRR